MILILFDSLRNDMTSNLHGIFPEETWSSYRTIETFTAPVLAATITSKTPEELGMTRTDDDFSSPIPNLKPGDETLFSHFDSWITVGRLEGNGPRQMPPSRRNKKKFLPPIPWNAQSNWDPDILNYVGRKWSIANNDWWDLIFWHSFTTHGPYSLFTGEGPLECPEVKKNQRRLANRMSKEEVIKWYMKGVDNAVAALQGIRDMCGNKETIICFADHGELLFETDENGERLYGHYAGMKKLDNIGIVPIWINKDEKIPDNINNLTLKDWVVKMYEKYELNNEQYQAYKQAITQGKPVEQPENWNLDLTPEDEAQIKERLIKLGYLGETGKSKAKKQK